MNGFPDLGPLMPAALPGWDQNNIAETVQASYGREMRNAANDDRVRAQIETERWRTALLAAQLERYNRETPHFIDEARGDALGSHALAKLREDENRRNWGLHPSRLDEARGDAVSALYKALGEQRGYGFDQQADPARLRQIEADADNAEAIAGINADKLSERLHPGEPRSYQDMMALDRQIRQIAISAEGVVSVDGSGLVRFIGPGGEDAPLDGQKSRDWLASVALAQHYARQFKGRGAAEYYNHAKQTVHELSETQKNQLAEQARLQAEADARGESAPAPETRSPMGHLGPERQDAASPDADARARLMQMRQGGADPLMPAGGGPSPHAGMPLMPGPGQWLPPGGPTPPPGTRLPPPPGYDPLPEQDPFHVPGFGPATPDEMRLMKEAFGL